MFMKTTIQLGVIAVAVTLASTSWGQTTVTNTNFSTGFFNTNQGWVRGTFVTGQNTNDAVAAQWQGNDPENEISPGVFVGGTDYLQYVVGYTPFGSATGNSSLLQGGLNASVGYIPGTTDVKLWRSFTPTASSATDTVSFLAEWSIIGSLDGSYPNLDTFSFDLRNSANTVSLLTLDLTPGINIQPNSYTMQSVASGPGTNTLIDLGYQALFQVQVDITDSTYDLQLAQINTSTRAVITNYNLVTGASLATGTSALDFGTVGLNWELSSTNSNDPGSNYIVVNSFAVTTASQVIPEPGTWAAGVVLLALGSAMIYRRRAAITVRSA